MGKHTYNPRTKQIVEVNDFAQHLQELANRISGIDVRKMIRNQ